MKKLLVVGVLLLLPLPIFAAVRPPLNVVVVELIQEVEDIWNELTSVQEEVVELQEISDYPFSYVEYVGAHSCGGYATEYDYYVLKSDGTTWYSNDCGVTWSNDSRYDSPVSAEEIIDWSPRLVTTKSGEVYSFVSSYTSWQVSTP